MKISKIIIGGKYRHYKGNKYVVLAVGKNSENPDEELVVYQGLYTDEKFGENPIWIRPKKMFLKKVIVNGKKISRFEPIK
jgi:hypothetical protein